MLFQRSILLLNIIHVIASQLLFQSGTFDSFFDIYKAKTYPPHSPKDITNSTWKEYFIAEGISNLIKITPFYIDNDKDVDLFIQDARSRLSWVSNIRGTSKKLLKQQISAHPLSDFVVSNQIYANTTTDALTNLSKAFYILAINKDKDKIIKFTQHQLDPTSPNITSSNSQHSYWNEEIFIDLNSDAFPIIKSLSVNSHIKSINLYELTPNEQLLLLLVENPVEDTTNLFKLNIRNERISTVHAIQFENNIQIIGAYDMNNDNLIDILYIDPLNNVYVLLNDDPYYHKVLLCKAYSTTIHQVPRLFITDSNHDNYADIVTADINKNTIGIYFNKGEAYWKKVKEYFNSNKVSDVYKDEMWTFIPLINVNVQTDGYIVDFTIIKVSEYKRISFEIVAVFDNGKTRWFIEKEVSDAGDINWREQQLEVNYLNSMEKCEIMIERQEGNVDTKYDMVLDVNVHVNEGSVPEFVLYSHSSGSLVYIKRYEVYLSEFGWQADFWIYLMIFIYGISFVIGVFEFISLKQWNDKYAKRRLLNEEDKKQSAHAQGHDHDMHVKMQQSQQIEMISKPILNN